MALPVHPFTLLAVTLGRGLVVTVFVIELLQPFASVPVTVYVDVEIIVNAFPFVIPPLQL